MTIPRHTHGSSQVVVRPPDIPPRRWCAATALIALAAAWAGACGDNLAGGDAGDSSCPTCDGGPPDAAPPVAVCDDGNACTADTVDGVGCRFDPVADGTICQDGDLCTLGDRCQTGECVAGARAEGELAILGHLDNLAGRRVRLAPDRFVVVTVEDLFRGRVQVVSRAAGGLTTLASWQGELTLIILGDDDILADAIDETGIVAVSALGERRLRFFSAGDAEVTPRGQLELDNQIISLAGRDDRLWLCTGSFVAGYQVTLVDLVDPDAPVEVGGMLLGPTPCGSIAINDDGHRVYVNTADGVRFVDATPLDTGGDPTLSAVIAPPAGVSISGSRLLLMNPTGVRILDEPSGDEIATVPVARARAAALFGDRLLVEGNRAVGGDSEVFVAWYDALAATPTLLDEAVLTSFIGAPLTGSFQSATDGATLLTGTRAFDLTGDRLDELRLPELLPLRTLARTDSGLRAYHSSGAAAIDLASPASPSYAAGGAFPAPRPILTVAIDDSLPLATFVSGLGQGLEDPTRVVLDPSNPYFPDPLPIARWTLSASAALVAESSFTVAHQGPSQLLTAGDFIYRFRRPTASPSATGLAAYWLPALAAGTSAVPVFDLRLPAASTSRRGFDVDPRARIAVVSTDAVAPSGEPAPALYFVDLSTSPPSALDTLSTDAVYPQLRVSGHRVAAVASDAIVFFEVGRGEVARLPSDSFETQLLAFDGTTAYLTQLHVEPGKATYQLVAIPFDDPAAAMIVEVDASARSLVPFDSGLAVGFDTQLLTLHPHCP